MTPSMRPLTVFAALTLGALAALGDTSREIKPDRTEILAIVELNQRSGALREARAELDKRTAQLDADTAAVVSEIRTRHGLTAGEQFSFNPQTGMLVVTVAPVTTSATPQASK